MVIASSDDSLANVLRSQIGLTGTKIGCGQAQCGCCNVIIDNKLVRSCVTKMSKVAEGSRIITVEGVGTPDNLHPVQLAWIVHGGAQCGFCTPGFIVSAKALLDQNQSPTRDDIREWFNVHRNACRCTGYKQLVDAVMDAAKVIRGEMKAEDLMYKIPEDGKIFGGKYPRPTAVAKVTGTLDYGADLGLKLPQGTLQLALVQAKVSHANIKGIDTSEAEKMPGVVKIVTHKDIKGKNRITGLITFPTNKGDGWDRPILCDEKVFQYGDAIAIVCAQTQAQAKAAAEKIKVDLEELPPYMSAPAVNCDENAQGSPFSVYMYGVFMAEVAVETATGKTNVEKMTLLADVGKINNKLVVDGQLYGGIAQGVGLALSEDFEDIQKHSTLRGAGFPYIKQIPDDMELIYVETPRPEGPFGAGGVGELPLTSPHAAIINGIYNACGVRITRLPALPEKVLAGLKG